MSQVFDYAQAAQDADELIREFGQAGTILSTPERDIWDDTPPAAAATDCTVVVLPIESGQTGYDVAGTLIKAGDVQILCSVVGLEKAPTTTDRVVTANGTFNIVRVNPLAPAGVAVLYDIVGRL